MKKSKSFLYSLLVSIGIYGFSHLSVYYITEGVDILIMITGIPYLVAFIIGDMLGGGYYHYFAIILEISFLWLCFYVIFKTLEK